MVMTVSVAFPQNPSTSANISYTLEDKKEADESDVSILSINLFINLSFLCVYSFTIHPFSTHGTSSYCNLLIYPAVQE